MGVPLNNSRLEGISSSVASLISDVPVGSESGRADAVSVTPALHLKFKQVLSCFA